MRRLLSWFAGAAMVALAVFVGQSTLDAAAQQAPFATTARLGERVETRTLAVTVHRVRAAEELRDAEGWTARGAWVVVDLDAEALGTETAASLALAELEIDGRRIGASERPASLEDEQLSVGLVRTGSLAFELPPGTVTGQATLLLGRSADPRLDGVVELPIDLGALERTAAIELEPTGWAS